MWKTLLEFERDLEAQREDLDAKITSIRFVEQRRNVHLKAQASFMFQVYESAINETKY